MDKERLDVVLQAAGATGVQGHRDNRNSISSEVLRCRLDGRLTVAVASDVSTKTAIGALLDVLDLHGQVTTWEGGALAPEEVGVVVAPRSSSEAWDALGTLAAAQRSGPRVRLMVVGDGGLEERPVAAVDFTGSDVPAHYLALMQRVSAGPPELLTRVAEAVGRSELRAYPMLTSHPSWSLRLEGLEIGRFRPGLGRLGVGRDGDGGRQSEARKEWVGAAGTPSAIEVTDDGESVARAANVVNAFAQRWFSAGGGLPSREDEHALESRILRGACPVVVPRVGQLQRLREPDGGLASWGSQFPTRWGLDPASPARYLDALLRDGDVPWAIEMKVSGGGGVGRYYRHAIGQAVLYRHFIRSADQLDPWFTDGELDRSKVRAAVVVPDLADRPEWRGRLQSLCGHFDVAAVEIEQGAALLR